MVGGRSRLRGREDVLREIRPGDPKSFGEQLHLVRLGRAPVHLVVGEHGIQHHDFSSHQGGARLPPVAVLVLLQGPVDRPRVHMIDVTAIRTTGEPLGELALDERVKKVTDVLAVADAGETPRTAGGDSSRCAGRR